MVKAGALVVILGNLGWSARLAGEDRALVSFWKQGETSGHGFKARFRVTTEASCNLGEGMGWVSAPSPCTSSLVGGGG